MEDLEIKQEIERTIIAFFTEMNGWEIYCEDIDNNPDLSEKEKTLCRDFAIDRTPPICVIDPIKVTEKGFQVQTICEDNIDFAKILLYKNGSLYKESKNQKSSWWLRTPNTYYTSCVYVIGANNKIGFSNAYDKNGVRPAFCVPGDCKMETDQDGHRVLQQRQ